MKREKTPSLGEEGTGGEGEGAPVEEDTGVMLPVLLSGAPPEEDATGAPEEDATGAPEEDATGAPEELAIGAPPVELARADAVLLG